MSQFTVYVDGALFYHPDLSELAVTEAKIEEDAQSIDRFILSAPFTHPYITKIHPLASTIICKKGDQIVFEGRALDDGTDFYNTHTWICESALAFLKDSLQPPYHYQGPLRGLLELFLSSHNSAVEEKKQFVLGTVTVSDTNDYVAYESGDYSVTLDAIKEKLLDTHGGYLKVSYTADGKKQLDYLADFTAASLQIVEYGKNLLDVKINRDHTKRVSMLIPLGAKSTETDSEGNETERRVDITSVNGGLNYVEDADTTAEIGKIWTTEIWDDVTLPENLLRKAQARLPELKDGITSMELSIVDESDTGSTLSEMHAGEYIRCLSKPHGIDGRYLCLARTRDYLHPASNTITIGARNITLSKAATEQSKNLEALSVDIEGKTEEINSAVSKADTALAEATQAKDAASSLEVNVQQFYSEITKTAEQINSAVREEYVSKSDLETLRQDFSSSITQTSTELRLDYHAKTDEIRGNVIANQQLLEEYIRFRGTLIELGKIGNAFTAELSNEQLAFKENGQVIAYISNQSLVITNAEIRYRLSLGTEGRGWFDFIPRPTGNLSVVWRASSN